MAKIIIKEKKNKTKHIQTLVYIAVIILSIVFIYVGNKVASREMTAFGGDNKTEVVKAEITEIVEEIQMDVPTSGEDTIENKDILFKAQILAGNRKGEEVEAVQNINNYFAFMPKEVAVGDKILMYQISSEQYSIDWVYGEYLRTDKLMILALVFAGLILLFGRLKGLQTLVSLVFTVLAVFLVFIPAVLSGYNIYFWSILVCLYSTVMTLVIVSGVNLKTLVSIIGCMSGVTISAVLVVIMDYALKLTGFIDEESVYLLMMNPENPIDLKAIIFGAIVIGAMGAIMDVAMSISSALYEMREKYDATTFGQLVSSGMTIGRDIMGTMANTLVLAYIGGSLSIVLLLITYSSSVLDLLNREMVIVEMLQAIVGSMGILLTLPLTAIVAGLLYAKKPDTKRLRNKI